MSNNIPELVLKRMIYLEDRDSAGRSEGKDSMIMYQVARDAGKFLSLLASIALAVRSFVKNIERK